MLEAELRNPSSSVIRCDLAYPVKAGDRCLTANRDCIYEEPFIRLPRRYVSRCRDMTPTASVHAFVDERTDLVNCLLTFRQPPPCEQMPTMPQALPDLQLNIHPIVPSSLRQS